MSSPTPDRALLMIPGPTEYENAVLAKLGEPSISHVSPTFINEFGQALERTRAVLGSTVAHPFLLSGSGTLGWDVAASNLAEAGHDVLVVNTGYFSDSFSDCCATYGLNVHEIKAPVGAVMSVDEIRAALRVRPYQLVLLTQVDTSTAVLNDIAGIAAAVRAEQPNAFIAVDGVCSMGGETFEFDAWGIDFALSCSQKALGAPPGLSVMLVSPRAWTFVSSERKTRVSNYYGSLLRWMPIMTSMLERKPAYFATPNVNLVRAYNVSLGMILDYTMAKRVADHVRISDAFKAALESVGIKQVPSDPAARAHTLTAAYFPEGVDGPKFLGELTKNGVVCAGGLHKDIRALYFRVGHMGVSVAPGRTDVLRVVRAIEAALQATGYAFEAGKLVATFEKLSQQ